MGTLSNKYPDVPSVENALDRGTDAYSSTQTLTEDVTLLKEDLSQVETNLGLYSKSFTYNTSHSAANDKIELGVNSGDKINVIVKTNPSTKKSFIFIGFKGDSVAGTTIATLYTNVLTDITLDDNYTSFGVSTSSETQDTELKFYIITEDGLTKMVNILEKDNGFLQNVKSVVKTNELMDDSSITKGGYYNATTGEWIENTNYYATGLIPVEKSTTYYVEAENLTSFLWAGYSEEGVYVNQGQPITSSDGKTANFTTSATSNIAFIRLSFQTRVPSYSVSVHNTETIRTFIETKSIDGLDSTLLNISNLLQGIDGEVIEIKESLYEIKHKSIIDIAWTVSKFTNTSGAVSDNPNFRVSEKIDVIAGEEIQYSLTGYNNVVSVIAAYDSSDNFIKNASIYYNSSYGTAMKVIFSGTYIVPDGVSYITFCDWNNKNDSLQIPEKIFIPTNLDTRLTSVETAIDSLGLVNQWKDKRISAFGTSITDTGNSNNAIDPEGNPTGKYLKYLVNMGEFKPIGALPSTNPVDKNGSINYGIAGGCINGHILYYIRYYLHDAPDSKLGNQAELITIEGSVNDYASNIPLGNVGDTVPYTNSLLPDSTADGTFAGACYCAFTDALRYAPNAVVVYLTETTGKLYTPNGNNFWQGRKNGLGLTQNDYIEMAIAVAKFVGIPVIDCGRDSMINSQNPQYLVDWIHHTELGGKQYASVIWSKLKNIPCKTLTIDN